ncbi:EAL domain-containing protein [Chungangia koreensis]|uniref:EAL domain-containing protein n=1 Tax=Chungangia koreensis TaxID=752657 RepID=A0ABV8X4B7_9LACT
MPCQSCIVQELSVDIKFEGPQNQQMLDDVRNHLNRRDFWFEETEGIMTMTESGVKELLDFSQDYMEIEHIDYRFEKSEWKPFSTITHLLDKQWIDEVIQKKLIVSHSQPIVNRDGEIFAYEILSRFQREDGSVIYPNEIFDAARTRGRLYALDRICRLTAVEYAAVLGKKVFINFIPTSIYSPEFCLRSTVMLAKKLGIDPSQFVFEVVESDQVDDIDHLKSILAYYNERGFQYALDDVGEGFSTIEMLEDIRPHFMKLDMKYVQGVSTDPTKQSVAASFLRKSLEIGSIPLAEGIETMEDFEWLKGLGYELFQGYLFGKPSAEPQREIKLTKEQISSL